MLKVLGHEHLLEDDERWSCVSCATTVGVPVYVLGDDLATRVGRNMARSGREEGERARGEGRVGCHGVSSRGGQSA